MDCSRGNSIHHVTENSALYISDSGLLESYTTEFCSYCQGSERSWLIAECFSVMQLIYAGHDLI